MSDTVPGAVTGIPGVLARTSTARLIGRDLAANLLVILLLVFGMQMWSEVAPDYIMPAPAATLGAAWKILTANGADILITLARLLAAVAFALVVGCLLGAVMALVRPLTPYLRSLIVINTGIPALSWMLFAVFWFKNPEARIFFILAMILIPFYALSMYDAIKALPTDLIEMVEVFRPSRLHLMRFLVLPHVVPYVLSTTKAIIGYAARMTVFAELISSNIGMGARMSLAQNNFHMDQMIAWTVLLVVLNLLLQAIVAGAEKLLLGWRPEVVVR